MNLGSPKAVTGRRSIEIAVRTAHVGVGSIGSHLPRTVRKWSLRHRRIVD